MRWLRALWAALLELSKPPEGASLEEATQWAVRRFVLRGAVGLLVAPFVIGGWFAWDAYKDARAVWSSPCVPLFPAEDLARWAPGPIEGPRAVNREGGCWASWSATRESGLTTSFLEVELHARSLPQPKRKVLETWDWDRPERVVIFEDTRGHTALVTLADGRALTITTWDRSAPISQMVMTALERLPPK